jgi:hypothetical protein
MEHDSRDDKNMEKPILGQVSNLVHDDRVILQPVRFRYSSVLADVSNWKFMASELRFVLYSGSIFWIIYLLSLAL